MQKSSKQPAIEFLADKSFKTVLDYPSGNGWQAKAATLAGRAETDEERGYWPSTSQNESLYGRPLIVHARTAE